MEADVKCGAQCSPRDVPEGHDAACPACGRVVVARSGWSEARVTLRQGACPGCGAIVPGLWG